MRSSFKSDLDKEQRLQYLLDSYYQQYLRFYDFQRVNDINMQMQGIDLVFANKSTGKQFFVDEKAQLDYINEELPTFAFELFYLKNGKPKKGWLFDVKKKTHFYALVTSIFKDEPDKFTSCKITFVNRDKLFAFLHDKKVTEEYLDSIITEQTDKFKKVKIPELHPRKEGYLYFSSQNKAEKPINLILKLDFLIEQGIAKRFI